MLVEWKRKAADALRWASDERYRHFWAQRRIVNPAMREEAANETSRRLPKHDVEISEEERQLLARFERYGWVSLPDIVQPGWVDSVLDYFAVVPAHDAFRPHFGTFLAPDDVPPETHTARYRHADIVRAPHLMEIANHPAILRLVSQWLGCKPTLEVSAWWSTPTPDGAPERAENFHRDVDDLRFVKLFLYLTDVTDTSGPHMYVEGTHRIDELTEIRRFSEEEVEAIFGADRIRRQTGTAGTLFLENTYGVHRGLPPQEGPRLLFQALYSQRPTIYGPRRPVISADELPFAADPYINRCLVAS